MNSGRRFRIRRLPAYLHAGWQVGGAAWWLTVMTIGLRWRGYGRVYLWLARRATDETKVTTRPGRVIYQQSRAVRRAARWLPYATCLPRSLTLWYLLRRHGLHSDLHVGVRKEGETFTAHAWVEYQGQALAEPGEVRNRFIAFDQALTAQNKDDG